MLEFLKKVFANDKESSRSQAKKRLHVVLAHDRMETTPEFDLKMNTVKEEIIAVIARHFDIEGNPDVSLVTEGRHMALDISIPIKGR